MTIRLGIVMDPIEDIHFKKDSSLAMLLAAQKRGWEIEYMELPDMYLEGGRAMAHTRALTVHNNPENWFNYGPDQQRALGDLDVILMRKDPPVDREFLMATYILEAAEQQGALVVNPASTLRDCNEKLFATQFEDLTPPLLVTRSAKRFKEFYARHGDHHEAGGRHGGAVDLPGQGKRRQSWRDHRNPHQLRRPPGHGPEVHS